MILGIFWMLVEGAAHIFAISLGSRTDDEQMKRRARDAFTDSKEGRQIERLRRELEQAELRLKENDPSSQKGSNFDKTEGRQNKPEVGNGEKPSSQSDHS